MDRKRTIGVTGGNGFIGSYVVDELLERGYKVAVLDRMDHSAEADPGRFDRMNGDTELHLGDIRDEVAVTEFCAHVDGVIHLAGCLGTQETIANPVPAATTNILGGLNVLKAVTQYGLPMVNIAVGNWFEDNTYSLTKHTVERFCNMFRKYQGTRVTTVRALNAYGPRQSVAAPYGTSKVRKIMPSFVMRGLCGDQVEVYGDGEQIMDMIFVEDVAKALVAAWELTAERGPVETVLEAGSGLRTTVNQILATVLDETELVTGKRSEVVHVPMRPGETPGAVVVADPSTLHGLATYGWDVTQAVGLTEGVRQTVAYYHRLMEEQ